MQPLGNHASTPGRGEMPARPAGLDPVVADIIEAVARTWLTMTTISSAGSSSSRTVAAMAISERLRPLLWRHCRARRRSTDRGATHAGRRKDGDDEVDEVTVFAIMAAILDRELQERGFFSIGRAVCEAIIRRVVGDTAALANESLTAPLNFEMIEQEPGSR
jgi:hypothetical protein